MKEKKTFNLATRGRLRVLSLCFVLGIMTFCSQHAFAQCSLACNGTTQVSLDSDCESLVTPDMIINGAMSSCPNGQFKVFIYDIANNVIPTSPYVTDAVIGKTLKVAVVDTSVANGNECWGNLIVEDKIAPTIECVQDTSVKCYQVESIRPTAFDNCSDVRIELVGQTETINDCQPSTGLPDNVLKVLTRTYRAVDAQGMVSDECTININVTRLDSLEEIVAPAAFLQNNGTALRCDGGYAVLPNGHPSPTAVGMLPGTGVPMLDTFPLYPSDGQFCNLLVSYTDTPLPPVQCVQKIMRRWDVFEWSCSSPQRQTSFVQMIEIVDTIGPSFTCPSDIVASTSGYECEGYVLLPALTDLQDNCSSQITVDVNYAGGILRGQNGGLAPIPVGTSQVTYIAYDECGRSSSCVINVTVEDQTPPVAVCDQNTAVALTNSGEAYVNAFTFDDGSYDDCALESYVVRRMADSGVVNCMPCQAPVFEEFTYLGEVEGHHYYLSRWAKSGTVAFRYADALGGYVYSVNTPEEGAAVNELVQNVTGATSYYIGYRKERGSSVFRWDDESDATYTNWAASQPLGLNRFVAADVATGLWSEVNGDTLLNQFIVEIEDPCGYSQYAKFCCDDLNGNPHLVQFRAIDAQGNWNECMVNVEVQDKVPPTLICPADMTVDCEFAYDPTRLSDFFGHPTIIGNCSPLMVMDSVTELNQCNIGTITRTFTVMDANSFTPTVSCEQIITFINDDPFVFSTGIVGPDDVSMPGCADPDSDQFLPELTGEPEIVGQDACDLIGYNYTDQVFTFNNNLSDPSCFKILRTFTIIDWCQSGNGGPVPSATYVQTIKVVDQFAPEFTTDCAAVTQCTFDSQCQSGTITLSQSAIDTVCTAVLDWRGAVNPFGNTPEANWIVFTGSGNTATITEEFPIGDHQITWTFIDRCGNQTSCLQDFSIANCKAPTPYCLNGLAVDLMPMDTDNDGVIDTGMVALWANDFDAGSFHPCPGYEVLVSFSADPLDTGRVFTCADIGDAPVMIWATAIDSDGEFVLDTAGNMLQAFCNTFVDVQDNMNACDGIPNNPARVAINGAVQVEDGSAVLETKVQLLQAGAELQFEMTDQNGGYAFPLMNAGGQYEVKPTKSDDHDNGVSTLDLVLLQRHILGIQALPSAYKIIAADVNADDRVTGTDVVQLRKLILGVIAEFPDNSAWRFVDGSYTFIDEEYPLDESFPETYSIADLATDMSIDFTAIKVGDINGSASLTGEEVLDGRMAPVQLTADQSVMSNQGMTMSIRADQAIDMSGLQMALSYDDSNVEVIAVQSDVLDITAIDYRVADGHIYISIARDGDIAIEEGTELIRIQYESSLTQQAGLFSIDDQVMRAEIYDASYGEYALNLRYDAGQEDVVLYQNVPNPFQATTAINVYMPSASAATLSIYDVTGKMVASYNRSLDAGLNTITVDKQDLNTTGVLFYTLSTDDFTATKRMVVLR